jgi:hypothetical protein
MTRTINTPFRDVKHLSAYSPEKQPDYDFLVSKSPLCSNN